MDGISTNQEVMLQEKGLLKPSLLKELGDHVYYKRADSNELKGLGLLMARMEWLCLSDMGALIFWYTDANCPKLIQSSLKRLNLILTQITELPKSLVTKMSVGPRII